MTWWSPELMLCAARVEVGPVAQQYWVVWDRAEGHLWQRTRTVRRPVHFLPGRMTVDDANVHIDVDLDPTDYFEVYRPEGRAYIWSRKEFSFGSRAAITREGVTHKGEGVSFVDVNAGYLLRHAQWKWSAGRGIDSQGRSVAWNASVGLFDTPTNSERTIWIDGVAKELQPVDFVKISPEQSLVTFAEGGEITFLQEVAIRDRVGLLLTRSTKHGHAFGTYSGTLPGGIEVREALGVLEYHESHL